MDLGGAIDLFRDVYLQETYVASIRVGREVVVELDCAVLPGHRLHDAPREGSVHAYAEATLRFPAVTRLQWDHPSDIRYRDGETSWLGEVDEFRTEPDGSHHLAGSYGELTIESDAPTLDWASAVSVRPAEEGRERASAGSGRSVSVLVGVTLGGSDPRASSSSAGSSSTIGTMPSPGWLRPAWGTWPGSGAS